MTLEADGWVSFNDEARGRGRPVRLWHLTEQAWQRFPDSHSELTLQLIDNIQQLFGEVGMERLIAQREQQQLARYQAELTQPALADRLAALTAQRTREGYMADFRQEEDGSWLLWESHCPICAAARACRGFCRSELEMFRRLLAPAGVDREQYLLEGITAVSIASGRSPDPRTPETTKQAPGCLLCCLREGCSRSSPSLPDKVRRLMGLLTR